ncbi:MAG: chemotaxis protein CheW [Rhodospirillaceae bacterium]|nr:chemotaxis protein CheW [Rhodospirillaceae bacterium]
MIAAVAVAETGMESQLLIAGIGGHTVGIRVGQVLQILEDRELGPVPRAPGAVVGVFNLRGRVVTAIDLRARLGLAPVAHDHRHTLVVVTAGTHLYALRVDGVAGLTDLPDSGMERLPSTIAPEWREIFLGLFRLGEHLVLVLDLERVLDFGPVPAQ